MFYDIEISDELFYESQNPPILKRQFGFKNLLKLTDFENNNNETFYYSELNINEILYRSGPNYYYENENNEESNKINYSIPKIKKITSEYYTKKENLKSPIIKRINTY